MHSIVYSNEAEEDIREIFTYIAEESLTNALAYLERYEKKIVLLQDNPKMGTLCKNKNINKECRVLKLDSHLMIYEEDEEKCELFIVRIFHQAVNYPSKV